MKPLEGCRPSLEVLGFTVGNLFEWVGWEVNTYFNALTHDKVQIAAVGAMMNVVYFVFDIGGGFMASGRSRINILLGGGHFKVAKKLACILLIAALLTSAILGSTLYFTRNRLAPLLAGLNETGLGYLLRLMALYSIFMVIDIFYMILAGLSRSTNHVAFSATTIGLFCFVLNAALCVWIRSRAAVVCAPNFISMYLCSLTAIFICLVKILTFDWSQISLLIAPAKK